MVLTVDLLPEYLTWDAPEGSAAVRISHDVVQRLTVQIMRGFGVTRRRGTEMGGILLGRVDRASSPVIFIEGFEAVPCEYAFGPSYILSAEDQVKFARAAELWKPDASREEFAIGYFRSHTREGLSIDKTDAELFSAYLKGLGQVALIIKPYGTRTSEAGLFLPEADGLNAGPALVTFPFSPKLLAATHEPAAAPAPDPPAPPIPQAAPPVMPVAPPVPISSVFPNEPPAAERLPRLVSSPLSTLALALLLAMAGAGLGFVAGYRGAGGRISFYPELRFASGTEHSPYQLGLQAEAAGERVRIRWSADSPPAVSALSGSLSIEESGTTKVVALQPVELRGGTVLYQTRSTPVRFRLELKMPENRSATETVSWSGASAP